jgi:8-amino-7-oxononanoate synthase
MFHVKHSGRSAYGVPHVSRGTSAPVQGDIVHSVPSEPGSRPEPPDLESDLERDLRDLESRDRLRRLHLISGADRVHLESDQGPLVAFCSNDYLGLSTHPALADAAAAAAASRGYGAGAARLLSGHGAEHADLESDLAALVRLPAALLFPTGYQANLSVISALAGRHDLLVSDAANHASIIDGCRLARAHVSVYRHADLDSAARALATEGSFRRRWLVTESLFSMDGDRAPLADLHRLVETTGASLIVDEAHALGVAGPEGRGLCAAAGIRPTVLVGTLGKAFGAFGGFAAGSTALCDTLVNRARPFIFTTATPPPLAAAARAGVALALTSEGAARRQRASLNAARLRTALSRRGAAVSGVDLILPVTLGADRAALQASRALRDRGFLVPAVRPPTVPEGTARLRVTVSASHTHEEVDGLAAALGDTLALPLPPET